jgi:hypothetical protein
MIPRAKHRGGYSRPLTLTICQNAGSPNKILFDKNGKFDINGSE